MKTSYFSIIFKHFFYLLLFFTAACRPDVPSSDPEKEAPAIIVSPSLNPPLAPSSGQPQALLLGGTFSTACGLSPEQGYAALLQRRLTESRAPFAILNASVAGETAAGAFERLRYLLGQPLRQVILELGQTDEARQTAPGAFARDVRKLLRSIRTQHPDVPILILPSTHTPAYYEALAEAARETDGVVLSSLLLEIGGPIRSEDTALHRRLAEALQPLIVKD